MVPYFKGRKLIRTYIYIYVLLFWFVIITSRIYLRKKVLVSAFKKLSKERIFVKLKFLNAKFDPSKAFLQEDRCKFD